MTIFKQEGPEVDYPDRPNEARPFVVQVHWRGVGAHLDFRFLVGAHAEGWTVSCQKPGRVKVPVVSLLQAREHFKDQSIWKFDLKSGRIFPRKVKVTSGGRPKEIIREGALLAHQKASIVPKEWLDVEGRTPYPPDFLKTLLEYWDKWPPEVQRELRREGLTPEFARAVLEGNAEWKDKPDRIPVGATRAFPGVLHVVCRGTFTLGARKPWFFEYFVEEAEGLYQPGQRLLFRLVRRAQKGEEAEWVFEKDEVLPPAAVPEEEVLPGFWLFMTPDPEGDIPYVLTEEAVEKEWLPPYPASALPKTWQKRIPKNLRYWEEKDRDKALMMRKELVERLKEGELEKATDTFFYSVVTFRGPIQVRWGPSRVIYYLGLELGNTRYLFALDNDLRLRDTVAGLSADLGLWKHAEALGEDWEEVEPGTPLNPTKSTPARGRKLDKGIAELILEKPGFLKVHLKGEELQGEYVFGEEMPGAGIWLVGAGRKVQAKSGGKAAYRFQGPELCLVSDGKGRRFKFLMPLRHDGIALAELEETQMTDITGDDWDVIGNWFKETETEGEITFSFPGLKEVGLPTTWIAIQVWTGQWLLVPSTFKQFQVVHKDTARKIVYGVVLTPYGPDAQGDIIAPEEIERAAHLYLIFGRQIGVHHEGDPILAFPVESFIAPCDFEYVPGDPDTKVRKGEWVLAAKIFDDEVWEKIVKGELTGWSIQGFGRRIPLGNLGESSVVV